MTQMTTYVMLTRLSPQTPRSPEAVKELTRQVREQVTGVCPAVRWLSSSALEGPYDHIDVFEAPDGDTAARIGLLVRSLGHGTAETSVATPWERFLAVTARRAAKNP